MSNVEYLHKPVEDFPEITDGVRLLPNPDVSPWVCFSGNQVFLMSLRNGEPSSLEITKRVAEELISAGFSYEG